MVWNLTAFQRDLLVVISSVGPDKGLAIKDELSDYYAKGINHGRLYPNLDVLVDKGMVDKGKMDRRTNSYELTDQGKQELKNRREWEAAYLEG